MTRADDIQQQQQALKRELESIQNKCTHKSQTIRWSPEESSYKWECDLCRLRLRYPTITEINEYLT